MTDFIDQVPVEAEVPARQSRPTTVRHKDSARLGARFGLALIVASRQCNRGCLSLGFLSGPRSLWTLRYSMTCPVLGSLNSQEIAVLLR